MQRAMKRIGLTVLLLVAVLGGACGRGHHRDGATPRLNVLHIVIDDQRPSLGAYADLIAKPPAMDRPANLGVRFDRANPGPRPNTGSETQKAAGLRGRKGGRLRDLSQRRERAHGVGVLR